MCFFIASHLNVISQSFSRYQRKELFATTVTSVIADLRLPLSASYGKIWKNMKNMEKICNKKRTTEETASIREPTTMHISRVLKFVLSLSVCQRRLRPRLGKQTIFPEFQRYIYDIFTI